MIPHLDAQIGRLIEALEKTGQRQNTLIVYTSDHSLAVGQHGLVGKQNMYERSIRIPFILNEPTLPENKVISKLVSQIDIFPTLCSIAGIKKPETVEGKSLLPLIQEETEEHRPYVHGAYLNVQRMVKNERFKLIRYYRNEAKGIGTNYLQLFDLVKDPWEMKNLASELQYKDILEKLTQELRKWQEEVNDPLKNIQILE